MSPVDRRLFLQGTAGALALAPFAALPETLGYPRLMEGPMVGAAGPAHFSVWARASGPYALQIEYTADAAFRSTRRTAPVQVGPEHDYTAVLRVDGLEADTPYYYRVLVNGGIDRYRPDPFATKTAPAGPAGFRVAFGSCARIARDPEQWIFPAIAAARPDLFFWLGDNVYADTETASVLAEEYRRQRNVPNLQALLRSVPQLAIWDDHDFGVNNSDGSYPFKAESLAVFRRYWANPAAGLADTPGVFFEYSYGGIDFFFLDGRYHRTPNAAPDGPDKTLLGVAQKRWLKERLAASTAPFKILVSGSGWSKADGPEGDTWSAFLTERNEIFDHIRDRRIGGVVCLSGDSHVGELNCIPWSERGGYDFYDLVSSPLAQAASMTWQTQSPERRLRDVHARGPNFGLLEFTGGAKPSLTFTLHDIEGRSVWKPLRLTPDQLRNGVPSWRSA